jgi:anti-sigma B factor antagonist
LLFDPRGTQTAVRPADIDVRGGAVTLSLSSHRDGDSVTVAVHGDIDLATAGQLEQEMSAHAGGDARALVVDLSGVEFIDSAGINALLKGRREADEQGHTFRVAGAQGIVREVLDLTGVLAHLSDPVQ